MIIWTTREGWEIVITQEFIQCNGSHTRHSRLIYIKNNPSPFFMLPKPLFLLLTYHSCWNLNVSKFSLPFIEPHINMKLEALKAQPVTKMSKVWWMQSLINDAVHAINFIIFYCAFMAEDLDFISCTWCTGKNFKLFLV